MVAFTNGLIFLRCCFLTKERLLTAPMITDHTRALLLLLPGALERGANVIKSHQCSSVRLNDMLKHC